MTTYRYLDTSSFVRRAELNAPNPSARSVTTGSLVQALLASSTAADTVTSEIGMAEFHDVVTSMWRDTNPPNDVYDEAWHDAVVGDIFDDLAAGRLGIAQSPPKVIEQALTNITMATRQHGRKFRVWDATHLITALNWSIAVGNHVELLTSDKDYESFTQLYPHFRRFVTVVNLDKI